MLKIQHPTISLPFPIRADLPNTPPLVRYLLHLISIKHSNLCVSADVHSTSALLRLAEQVGDYICVLKTHADIIDDFSEKTVRGLQEISKEKRFLIFEDRKFGDIGSTVQNQYARGPFCIATWAHLTNAHIFAGPAIIPALQAVAVTTLTSLNQSVSTEITVGTPGPSVDGSASELDDEDAEDSTLSQRSPNSVIRKNSVVTTTTTISQTYEPSPPNPAALTRSLSTDEFIDRQDSEEALQDLGPPPHARGILLLAEISSEGNLMTPAYTSACVAAARAHPDFVIGFVAQHSLNSAPTDVFLNFTPGVRLPLEEVDGGRKIETGDGLGQRWRTPREMVLQEGVDVVIVGRGILDARDRKTEAERYRKAAWEAYEDRIGKRNEG